MELHIHIHHHDNETKLDKIMAKIDDINTLLTEINDSTNNIAADLDRIAQQAEGGLSAQEAESVVTQLRSASDALKAVADRNPETGEPTEPGTPA